MNLSTRLLIALFTVTLIGGLLVRLHAATPTTATISWIAPIAYNDNSALPVTDLDHYTVTWSRTFGGPVLGTQTVKAPANSVVVPVLCGGYEFSVTVTTTATAAFPNSTSGPGGPVAFSSVVSCTPNPPTGLAVH